jgi:hypothetical protein
MSSSIRLLVISTLLPTLLIGCASGPSLAPADDDQKAKRFSPGAGKAAIYIYRKDGRRGSAVRFPVTVNGTAIGAVATGTYYVVEVEPGDHEVWVGWDQSMPRTMNDPIAAKLVLIPIRAVAGATYFVRAAQTGQEHVAVPETNGRQELLACCKRASDRSTERSLFQ